MPASSPTVRRQEIRDWSILGALALAAWAAQTFSVVSPVVLGDEYSYWLGAIELDHPDRLAAQNPLVAAYGATLFLRLANLLWRLGLPIDLGVKLLNLAALLGSWALLARAADGAPRSRLLLVAVLALPSASYAAYVMPECLYALGFGLVIFPFAQGTAAPSLKLWAGAGAGFALLTLVKSHGVMAFAAFELAGLVWGLGPVKLGLRRTLGLMAAALAAYLLTMVAAKPFLGAWAGAPDGAAPLGKLYTDWARDLLAHGPPPRHFVRKLIGYLAAAGLLYAPAVAALTAVLLDRRQKPGLPALAALTVLFAMLAASLAAAFALATEPGGRLHLRYLAFACPWLLVLAWREFGQRPWLDTLGFRLAAAGAWSLSAVLFLTKFHPDQFLPVDAPILFFAWADGFLGRDGLPAAAALLAASALLLLRLRLSWTTAQALLLIAFAAGSAWNLVVWTRAASVDAAALRGLGARAVAACGARHVRAVGTPQDFVRLYQVMVEVGKGGAFALDPEPAARARFDAAAPGDCVVVIGLTPPVRFQRLAAYGEVALYRAGTPAS